MDEKEYKKNYKPLVAWFVLYLVILIAPLSIIKVSEKASVIIALMLTVLGIDILLYIIYRGEYIYWFTGGPTFKEAKAATSESRKKYAKQILDLFIKMTLACMFYSFISILLDFSIWIDTMFFTVIIIITTFMTVPLKFEE